VTRIAIDLNVRVRGNLTYSGYEDIDGDLPSDGAVEVYEPESGLIGLGRVVERDDERRLVYLAVDWSSLRARPALDFAIPGNGVIVHYAPTFGGNTVPLSSHMPGAFLGQQLTA
jgi:hypothetical protein